MSEDWITVGRDSELPCGLGWAALGAWWAGCAIFGLGVAVIVEKLTRRWL